MLMYIVTWGCLFWDWFECVVYMFKLGPTRFKYVGRPYLIISGSMGDDSSTGRAAWGQQCGDNDLGMTVWGQ